MRNLSRSSRRRAWQIRHSTFDTHTIVALQRGQYRYRFAMHFHFHTQTPFFQRLLVTGTDIIKSKPTFHISKQPFLEHRNSTFTTIQYVTIVGHDSKM
jgi:hypothetical protein